MDHNSYNYQEEEFYRPQYGLQIEPYLAHEDIQGIHHLARYLWLEQVLPRYRPRKVLDVACGAGYGAYILACAMPDAEIVGCDYDLRAVRYASNNYQRNNLRFIYGDMVSWVSLEAGVEMHLGKYDAIVSFDTIEHLAHREIAMLRIVENLCDQGVFVLSTPCGHPETILTPEWHPHKIEYNARDLRNLLQRFFTYVLAPEDGSLPNLEYWNEVINKDKTRYLNLANPLVCTHPIKF